MIIRWEGMKSSLDEDYEEVHLSVIHNCGNCQYFHEDLEECRINSPVTNQKHKTAVWPILSKKDWCGKFMLRSSVLKRKENGK